MVCSLIFLLPTTLALECRRRRACVQYALLCTRMIGLQFGREMEQAGCCRKWGEEEGGSVSVKERDRGEREGKREIEKEVEIAQLHTIWNLCICAYINTYKYIFLLVLHLLLLALSSFLLYSFSFIFYSSTYLTSNSSRHSGAYIKLCSKIYKKFRKPAYIKVNNLDNLEVLRFIKTSSFISKSGIKIPSFKW